MLRRNTSSIELNDLKSRINKWKNIKVPHKKLNRIEETNNKIKKS